MKRRAGLSLCCSLMILLTACANKHRPGPPPKRVRVLNAVPPGLHCELIKQESANEGYGCGFAGRRGRSGQPLLAMNILRSKALRTKANTVVIREVKNRYGLMGCEREHIQVEADLMFCQQPVDMPAQDK